MKQTEFLSTIPFAGFYDSIHDGVIDDAFDMMFADRETGCDRAPDFIMDAARDAVSWGDTPAGTQALIVTYQESE